MTNLGNRLNRIDETRNYFLDQTKLNEFLSEKHKKVFENLNYFKHSLLDIFPVIGCLSISLFSSIVGIPLVIISSEFQSLQSITNLSREKGKSMTK